MGQLFINGQWINGHGETFTSLNPVDDSIVWQGASADQTQVQQAYHAAKSAFQNWKKTNFSTRKNILIQYAEILKSKKNDLALLISKENGKPLWEALTEVGAMIGKIQISIDAFEQRCAVLEKKLPGKQSFTRYKPHGVVAVFGPFNFPGHLANGHIVPALLAGNTILFKPSEQTPAVAEIMVRCFDKAGLPQGTLNLLQGAAPTGKSITDLSLDGVFFTGSSQTGKRINQLFSDRPETILALEMGGNNPLIVHQVKDIATASLLTIQSAFLTAGQRCTCSRRLIVPKGEAGDQFVNQLVKDIQKIKVGTYTDDPEPFMGPVIHSKAAELILEKGRKLEQAGGSFLVPNKNLNQKSLLSPGLIDVTAVKNRSDEEIFGPLLQLIRVDDFEAAINEANQTRYGLAAGLICDSSALYEKFYENINAGLINWNNQLTGASSAAPFGGIGWSGNHRPSAYFAADYCSYPVASMESEKIQWPEKLPQGLDHLKETS